MRPYALRKRNCKIHPHNECFICAGHPDENGTERMRAKKEIEKEVKNIDIKVDKDA